MFFFIFYFNISDPGYFLSYNLKNTGQYHGIPGEDVNIEPVWEKGYSGKGIHLAFIIDGCYPNNPDLKNNFILNRSFNFKMMNKDVSFSQPESLFVGNSYIGHACASLNGIGTVGPAFNSKFSVIIPKKRNSSKIPDFETQLFYNFLEDDIRIDYSSSNYRSSASAFYLFNFRFNPSISSHLDDAIYRGRNRKGTIYITPALSYFYEERGLLHQSVFSNSGEVIVVSSTNFRGSKSFLSLPSSEVLINAPASGNVFYGIGGIFPIIPSVSGWISSKLSDQTTFGFSASTVAGIVALLLEAVPTLTYRDIQWIILLTATKNDPNCILWGKNKAGYEYNPYYGFGRINADNALLLALKWIILPRKIKFDQKIYLNQFLPYIYQNHLIINILIQPNQTFYNEYLYLYFDLTIPDITMLKIYLESPQGSKFQVFFPIISNLYNFLNFDSNSEQPYRILIRNFFGEEITGNWKISFHDDSYLLKNKLKFCKLLFIGVNKFPKLPFFNKSIGSDPKYNFSSSNTKNFKIKLFSNNISCGEFVFFTQTWNNFLTLSNNSIIQILVQNRTTLQTVHLITFEAKMQYNGSFQIPCIFSSTNNLDIVFFQEDLFEYFVIPIIYQKKFLDGILFPKPYQRSFTEFSTSFNIEFKISNSNTQIFSYLNSLNIIISLYNVDMNRRLISTNSQLLWLSSFLGGEDMAKAKYSVVIISMVHEVEETSCSSFIVPLHILNTGDTIPSPFFLDLGYNCSVPNGIYIKPPEIFTPTPKNYKKTENIIIIFYIVTFILMLILLFFVYLIQTSPPQLGLDDQYLFQ